MTRAGWAEQGWHYRRSLASRVILLTTIAVGLAVALVALAVFLTVRIRCRRPWTSRCSTAPSRPPTAGALPTAPTASPVVGHSARPTSASSSSRRAATRTLDEGPQSLGRPGVRRARGKRPSPSARSCRRRRTTGSPRCRPPPGSALVLAQSLEPQEQVLSGSAR